MIDRLIRATTAGTVVLVAVVAAVVSYRHALELVRAHGESGLTAYLVPFTVDGLVWAASMVILDATRRASPVPALAQWSLGAGIVATVGANLAHGLDHGPLGAIVGAWPALALVGSYELLMMLLRKAPEPLQDHLGGQRNQVPEPGQRASAERQAEDDAERDAEAAALADYLASLQSPGPPASQRHLAAKHGLSRRKVKQLITSADHR
ncbi:DUF2637 domain-containing protein [Spirillospora sp. NPDC127200]